MLSIINALYYSGHEDNLQRFLSTDELSDYKNACQYRDKNFTRLSAKLSDEEKKLFQRFTDNALETAALEKDCAFRYGLAIGLKLSGFATSLL